LGFAKGGDILAFGKGGGILRLFSDRMPASFRKQQNIPPPFEKGGSGGISHERGGGQGGLLFSTSPSPLHHYPINLLHHRFRFCHYLPAVKIPPAPFTKGGDILGFLCVFSFLRETFWLRPSALGNCDVLLRIGGYLLNNRIDPPDQD
jgi:hypothetical protein